MTRIQLQRLLDSAGLSQRGAARELQIDERTMRRHVAGDSEIPRVVELAVRGLRSISRTGEAATFALSGFRKETGGAWLRTAHANRKELFISAVTNDGKGRWLPQLYEQFSTLLELGA